MVIPVVILRKKNIYTFRLSGELEEQFIDFLNKTNIRKSALIKKCIEIGLRELLTETALETLRYDQTHGFEITQNPRPSLRPLYQDVKGFYHLPFDIIQEGVVLKDIIDLRDGKKCRKCGQNNGMIVYHPIDGNSANQTIENIVTLCKKCEKELEEFLPKKYKKELFAIWFYMIGQKPRVYERETD